ncbi:hypothetical protein [Candidatus Albibeggiatoa sp. nov. BB20]|uniref:hypothetical protein n=1 Tax=Candidatus Albibeggiatoa sp. nov. BB20 TaxID=3162723 RepID=UPI003365A43C
MITVTQEDIAQFRDVFADNQDAMDALGYIDNCDGNLSEAMEIIFTVEDDSFHRGASDGEDFEKFLGSFRTVICNPEFEANFIDKPFDKALDIALGYLLASTGQPTLLLIPVLLYIFKLGLKDFCQKNN